MSVRICFLASATLKKDGSLSSISSMAEVGFSLLNGRRFLMRGGLTMCLGSVESRGGRCILDLVAFSASIASSSSEQLNSSSYSFSQKESSAEPFLTSSCVRDISDVATSSF